MKKLLVVVVLATVGLTGCGESKKKTVQVVDPEFSEYNEASCRFAFDEGPKIDAKIERTSRQQLRSFSFGKVYDDGLLKPVLAASASELVRFGATTGVRFYKSSDFSAPACRFGEALTAAPSDLESTFSALEDILGIYLSKKTPNMKSTNEAAAIVVRTDTNKWVLTHEYMHHLFQKQLESTPEGGVDIQPVLKQHWKELSQALDNYESELSGNRSSVQKRALLTKLLQKLSVVNQTSISFLKQYYLEEMTIETLLGSKLDSGELTLVHPPQRLNGAGYIISSAKKATDLIDIVKKVNTGVETDYGSALSTGESSQIRQMTTKLDGILNEVSRLKASAKRILLDQGYEVEGLVPTTRTAEEARSTHSGCAHEAAADEASQIIFEMAEKFN